MPYIEAIVTSESTFKNDKNFSKTIGIPIINEYGASELDLIAFQSRNTETKGNGKSIQKTCYLKF
jgi:phenylacetate-CoA ligase